MDVNLQISGMNNPGSWLHPPNEGDWNHVRETLVMLCLAYAQITATLNESDESIDVLTESFTSIANDIQAIISHDGEGGHDLDSEDRKTIMEIKRKVDSAVMAFQFYDRLTQRLNHVNESLSRLAQVISDEELCRLPEQWHSIQDSIRSQYTMECERIMFEQIMRGATIEEALEIYHHHFNQQDKGIEPETGDDIELF